MLLETRFRFRRLVVRFFPEKMSYNHQNLLGLKPRPVLPSIPLRLTAARGLGALRTALYFSGKIGNIEQRKPKLFDISTLKTGYSGFRVEKLTRVKYPSNKYSLCWTPYRWASGIGTLQRVKKSVDMT